MSFQVPNEGELRDLYIDDIWLLNQYLGTKILSWGYDNLLSDNVPGIRIDSTNWQQIKVGDVSFAGIKNDGSLWTWVIGGAQDNTSYGFQGTNDNVAYNTPTQTCLGGNNWKQLSVGNLHMGAVKTDGTLWMWGYDYYGQVGDGTRGELSTYNAISSPVQIIGSGWSGGGEWRSVDCSGSNYTMAIKSDGSLWGWGDDDYGQICVTHTDMYTFTKSSTTHYAALIPTHITGDTYDWQQISCGYYHTAGIKADGSLWLWGRDIYGELGDGANSNSKSSPVQTICGGNDWAQVSCGYHTAAIKTDGTLWTWGLNWEGQVGNGTTINTSSPAQIAGGGNDWRAVSCMGQHSAALKNDGTLWVWGQGKVNSLGDGYIGGGNGDNTLSPKQILTGKFFTQVACGYWYTSVLSVTG